MYVADYHNGLVRKITPIRTRLPVTSTLTASASSLNLLAGAVGVPECGQWGSNKLTQFNRTQDMPCSGTASVRTGTAVSFALDYQCITNGAACVTTYEAVLTLPDNSQQTIPVPANGNWSQVFAQTGTYAVSFKASCNGLSCQNTCSTTIQAN